MEYTCPHRLPQAPVTHHPAPYLIQASRSERLRRWSELLEDHPGQLTTLEGTEHYSGNVRDQMSKPGSALSLAFADPLLRSAGLEGETYGAAKRFFQLTDGQLHYIVCHCHVGSQMSGRATAKRVRCADPEAGLFGRVRRFFGGRSASQSSLISVEGRGYGSTAPPCG